MVGSAAQLPPPTPAPVDPRLRWGSLGSLPQLLLHASSSESRDPQWQELSHMQARGLGGAAVQNLGLSPGKNAFFRI